MEVAFVYVELLPVQISHGNVDTERYDLEAVFLIVFKLQYLTIVRPSMGMDGPEGIKTVMGDSRSLIDFPLIL